AVMAGAALVLAAIVHRGKPLWSSLLLQASLAGGGLLLAWLHTPSLQPGFIFSHYQPGMPVLATLQEPPVPKARSHKAEASLQLVIPDGRLRHLQGKAVLYLAKDEKAGTLQYGSQIIFRKPLQSIRSSGNPGSFDYAAYAARQGLYAQAFLQANDYRIAPGRRANPLQELLFRGRQWVLAQTNRFIGGPDEMGIAQALLIGYRADIDRSLLDMYASTGVVHVIAISGMHLGMIYGLLLVLLQPLGRLPQGRLIQLLVMLAAIWCFTLLTGAGPSIARAAIMFTCMSIGHFMFRQTSIYNTLAAAALLLVLHQPFVLWDAGFQLSFAAVLSIALFYQPIRQSWQPAQWITQKTWDLVAVTLAAQILTLPLAVYHFHQFPVYFVIANLAAVPLSGLALYVLLGMLALGWWPGAAQLAGNLAGLLLQGLNQCIRWVHALPFNSLSRLQLTLPQASLLYTILFALAWWWLLRDRRGMVAAALATLLLTLSLTIHTVRAARQHQLIIYQVPQYTAIDYVRGRQALFIGDSALQEGSFLERFHLQPARTSLRMRPRQQQLLDTAGNYSLRLGNTHITLLRSRLNYRHSRPLKTDILLVSGNPPGSPARILSLIHCRQIVLDGSNSAWRIARWKSAADSLHLRLHLAPQQGAFVLNLPPAGEGTP
ncbi:MAG: ComEC family competence protein, partial [Chitinophagaceae bacterium]|nr:ComEC family competence protein [Chitinophagaceae bacterium]